MEQKKHINIFIEQMFPIIITITGYFFFLFALLTFINNGRIIFIILFITIGIYLAFSIVGIQIDTKNKKFKYYKRLFFVKMGKSQSLSDYPDVCVLLVNQKKTSYSLSNVAFTTKSTVFKVFMFTDTHRQKLFIKKYKSNEEAVAYAKDFASRIGSNFTKYSPYISEATLSRRR